MGAFAASALATFERATGRRIVEHFDLITGTSTGGIIAVGLAMGASAGGHLLVLRNPRTPDLPGRGGLGGWVRLLRNLRRPKFSPRAFREAIQQVVGDRPLAEAKTRLVIPAYDAEIAVGAYLFKTPHPQGLAIDRGRARSRRRVGHLGAAPTYFPAHKIAERGTFIDGGVWANCPAMVGLVEASMDFLGQTPESDPPAEHQYHRATRSGSAERQQLGGAFLDGVRRSSRPSCSVRCASRIPQAAVCSATACSHRIDYVTEPGLYRLDNASCVQQLLTIGRNTAELQGAYERCPEGIPERRHDC